jgi:polysaccharide chain length determinant protein (PEP-CTERM system associated)
MNVSSGFQFSDVVGVVRRRGKVVLFTAGAVMLAMYWLAMALPNAYESYATVLVEPQSVSRGLVQAGVAESDLNERLHLMTAQILSRPRLSRIIDELELYEEESEELVREQVIGLMREAIRVEPVLPELERGAAARRRDSEINQFRISFHDRDGQVAAKVAQRLANDFIEEHISERVKVSQKSLEFIDAELERVSQRMVEIEARVATIKAENPGRLPEDVGANQRALERLTTEISRVQREADLARSDEAFWRSQAIAVQGLERPNDNASPTRRLQLLELQIAEYQSRGLTEKHPDYVQTRAELEAIRRQLIAQEAAREGAEVEPAPNYQQQVAEAERQRSELRMQTTQEEIDRLQLRAESLRTLLAETPRVAEQLDALGREYQSQLDSYQTYIARQQEASVQADMERRQLGEQFRVLEAAFVAPEPSSPNRILIFVLGALFGLAIGGGSAIMLETLDSSMHSARQLQTATNLPVLVAVPQIWLESDRRGRRRSFIRQTLAAAAVTGFVLLGGAANYAWVNGMPGFLKELTGKSEERQEGAAAAGQGQG